MTTEHLQNKNSTLNNSNVSKEAKQHAQDVLDNEIGGSQPQEDLYDAQGDQNKSPNRVSGGLKAAMHNPAIPESGKAEG
ncbi:hypothetical protein BDV12DRAFT_198922 [Aspergillus spectabilis]